MFIIGATLIAMVLLLPEGVAGGFAKLFTRKKEENSTGVG
jgi:hypothetical protein